MSTNWCVLKPFNFTSFLFVYYQAGRSDTCILFIYLLCLGNLVYF